MSYAEFESGDLTLSVADPLKLGKEQFRPSNSYVALHVDDVDKARAELEAKGVAFRGETYDSGVCHMAFFQDPDGNALMLHNRYALRPAKEPLVRREGKD